MVFTRQTSNIPVLALKIIQSGVGEYFGRPCYGNAMNCHFVPFAIPGTRPLFIRKQNSLVLSIRNRKKINFVQINMKQVSYISVTTYQKTITF